MIRVESVNSNLKKILTAKSVLSDLFQDLGALINRQALQSDMAASKAVNTRGIPIDFSPLTNALDGKVSPYAKEHIYANIMTSFMWSAEDIRQQVSCSYEPIEPKFY